VTCLLVLKCSSRCCDSWTDRLLNWNFGTILLREYLEDWIKNNLYFDTITASVFVTGETAVKVFIPVESVCYLCNAARTCLIVLAVVYQQTSAALQIFRLLRRHATIDIKIHSIPHRKLITSPLQCPTG
jgi:hypothetical protein